MGDQMTFNVIIIVAFAIYQVIWISVAYAECWKMNKVKQSGLKYTGVVTRIKRNYLRFSSYSDIIVRIVLENGEERELTNWPRTRRSPFPVGTVVELYYSNEYPAEYILADDKIAALRFLSPSQDGKLNKRYMAVRFALVWGIALFVILFVYYLQQ